MRYFVSLDSGAAPLVVDVVELPSGALDVRVAGPSGAGVGEGRTVAVDVLPLSPLGALSVRVDGRVVDLTTEGQPPEIGAVASGHRSYVRVESERMRAAEQAKKRQGEGAEKIVKSPMPGRVVKVLVAAGDAVDAGQALMVIEAMKMENEIRAKAACTVAEVHVKAGETVEGNARLVSLA